MSTIGACIVSYHSVSHLRACIEALQRAQVSTIVVVDNLSSDGSAELVERTFPAVRVLRMTENLGYARANNAGCEVLLQTGCEYLLIVNPDVEVGPEMPSTLREALLAHPTAGCAGGWGITPNGDRVRASFRSKPSLLGELLIFGTLRDLPVFSRFLLDYTNRLKSLHYLAPTETTPVYTLSGACMMIRASMFSAAGGFDERTFLFQEEPILSERMLSHGWTMLAVPGTHYAHEVSASTKRWKMRSQLAFMRSEYIMLRHYQHRTAGAVLVLAVRVFELAADFTLTFARRCLTALGLSRREK